MDTSAAELQQPAIHLRLTAHILPDNCICLPKPCRANAAIAATSLPCNSAQEGPVCSCTASAHAAVGCRYVCGVAKCSLAGLARGGKQVEVTANVLPYTSVRGAAGLEWSSRPGRYVEVSTKALGILTLYGIISLLSSLQYKNRCAFDICHCQCALPPWGQAQIILHTHTALCQEHGIAMMGVGQQTQHEHCGVRTALADAVDGTKAIAGPQPSPRHILYLLCPSALNVVMFDCSASALAFHDWPTLLLLGHRQEPPSRSWSVVTCP